MNINMTVLFDVRTSYLRVDYPVVITHFIFSYKQTASGFYSRKYLDCLFHIFLLLYSFNKMTVKKTNLFQVDMSKVKLDVIKPWITTKITQILGMEDDVVVEFVYNQLEEKVRIPSEVLSLSFHKFIELITCFLYHFLFK